MKLIAVAAALFLGFSPAFADDNSTIVRLTDHDKHVCETSSRGKTYSAIAEALEYAQHMAIQSCISGGGKSSDCHHNLNCYITDGGFPPAPGPTPDPTTSYYDWGRNAYGYGYCYQYDKHGQVMHNGRPVANRYCEKIRPSYYDWGYYVGQPHYMYCFQWTPYGDVMNDARPVSNRLCR